jgi:hypothetical protein
MALGGSQRTGALLGLAAAAKLDARFKTLEELYAGGTIRQVGLDLLAGGGRQFGVQILREECEQLLAVAGVVSGSHGLVPQFLRLRK